MKWVYVLCMMVITGFAVVGIGAIVALQGASARDSVFNEARAAELEAEKAEAEVRLLEAEIRLKEVKESKNDER